MAGIESYRDYLLMLARSRIGPRPPGPGAIDPSDVVQQALLKAHANLGGFRGGSREEMAAWLRVILEHQISDEAERRSRGPDRRSVSLDRTIEDSSRRIDVWLESNDPSPSGPLNALERSMKLAGALARLPAEHRRALELHYLAGAKVEEVAEAMERTPASVAGLIRRGVGQLREILEDPRVESA